MPITEKTPVEKVIKDFVHSDDPKFAKDSKKQRIKRALGAYYGMKKEEVDASAVLQATVARQKLKQIEKSGKSKSQDLYDKLVKKSNVSKPAVKEEVELAEDHGLKTINGGQIVGTWEHNPPKGYTGNKVSDRYLVKHGADKYAIHADTDQLQQLHSGSLSQMMNKLKMTHKPKLPMVKEEVELEEMNATNDWDWRGKNNTDDELNSRPGAWRGPISMSKRTKKDGTPTKEEKYQQDNLKARIKMSNKTGGLTGPKGDLPEETKFTRPSAGVTMDMLDQVRAYEGKPQEDPIQPVSSNDHITMSDRLAGWVPAHLHEISDTVKQSYKEKAEQEVKETEPFTKKGEYKDLAKALVKRRKRGIAMASITK